jgi:hypothetical protein
VIVEGTNNPLKLTTDYYKDLLGPAPKNLFQLSHELWGGGGLENLDDINNKDLTFQNRRG